MPREKKAVGPDGYITETFFSRGAIQAGKKAAAQAQKAPKKTAEKTTKKK